MTLLTIGFGDVTPVAPLARAVVLFEGIFGVVFTTIVMASLVAGYLRHRSQSLTPGSRFLAARRRPWWSG